MRGLYHGVTVAEGGRAAQFQRIWAAAGPLSNLVKNPTHVRQMVPQLAPEQFRRVSALIPQYIVAQPGKLLACTMLVCWRAMLRLASVRMRKYGNPAPHHGLLW